MPRHSDRHNIEGERCNIVLYVRDHDCVSSFIYPLTQKVPSILYRIAASVSSDPSASALLACKAHQRHMIQPSPRNNIPKPAAPPHPYE